MADLVIFKFLRYLKSFLFFNNFGHCKQAAFAIFVLFQKNNKLKPSKYLLVLVFLSLFRLSEAQIKTYDFDGFEPLMYQNNDTTYVINFWATWCVPCVKELPSFEKINQEYRNRKFKMILVSLDFGQSVEKRVSDFKNKMSLSAQMCVLDDPKSNTWIPKVDKNWSGSIPATLIYRKNKRQFYNQSFSYEELKSEIEKFIPKI